MTLRGLHKLQGAANTAQARRDYIRLLAVAARVGKMGCVLDLPADSGWRKMDKAAQVGVKKLLAAHPELRAELAEIYPGLVQED
ncbi:MAG: hypothetical protein MOB07_31140 [Acidobacteria bacterium]|nr:hypothetical protein [Acidobacteriota bacterium]